MNRIFHASAAVALIVFGGIALDYSDWFKVLGCVMQVAGGAWVGAMAGKLGAMEENAE